MKVIMLSCSNKRSPTDECLYRYDANITQYVSGERHITIYLSKYPIMRRTNKCDVIDVYGEEKFVLRDARKRYAYPTFDEAWYSFQKRCEHRLAWKRNAFDVATELYELSRLNRRDYAHTYY